MLRYDKRTFVTKKPITNVTQEVTEDAEAAVALLSGDPQVDRSRIIVVGHSFGGTLVPRIAKDDPRIAAIVALAGTPRKIEDVAVEQLAYLTGAQSPQTIAARETVHQINDPALTAGSTVNFLGTPTPGSYWLDLRGYDAARVAAALTIPMAFFQGGRDYQVTRTDFDLWTKALAGKPRVKLKLYPTLNHLFMTGSEPPSPQDYLKPGHVDPQVIGDLADFVSGR